MKKLVLVYDDYKEKVFSCLFEDIKAVNNFKTTADPIHLLAAKYMGQCVSDIDIDLIVKAGSVDEFFNAIKKKGGQRNDNKNSNVLK